MNLGQYYSEVSNITDKLIEIKDESSLNEIINDLCSYDFVPFYGVKGDNRTELFVQHNTLKILNKILKNTNLPGLESKVEQLQDLVTKKFNEELIKIEKNEKNERLSIIDKCFFRMKKPLTTKTYNQESADRIINGVKELSTSEGFINFYKKNFYSPDEGVFFGTTSMIPQKANEVDDQFMKEVNEYGLRILNGLVSKFPSENLNQAISQINNNIEQHSKIVTSQINKNISFGYKIDDLTNMFTILEAKTIAKENKLAFERIEQRRIDVGFNLEGTISKKVPINEFFIETFDDVDVLLQSGDIATIKIVLNDLSKNNFVPFNSVEGNLDREIFIKFNTLNILKKVVSSVDSPEFQEKIDCLEQSLNEITNKSALKTLQNNATLLRYEIRISFPSSKEFIDRSLELESLVQNLKENSSQESMQFVMKKTAELFEEISEKKPHLQNKLISYGFNGPKLQKNGLYVYVLQENNVDNFNAEAIGAESKFKMEIRNSALEKLEAIRESTGFFDKKALASAKIN